MAGDCLLTVLMGSFLYAHVKREKSRLAVSSSSKKETRIIGAEPHLCDLI